jgi:hypothetical protein
VALDLAIPWLRGLFTGQPMNAPRGAAVNALATGLD